MLAIHLLCAFSTRARETPLVVDATTTIATLVLLNGCCALAAERYHCAADASRHSPRRGYCAVATVLWLRHDTAHYRCAPAMAAGWCSSSHSSSIPLPVPSVSSLALVSLRPSPPAVSVLVLVSSSVVLSRRHPPPLLSCSPLAFLLSPPTSLRWSGERLLLLLLRWWCWVVVCC